jgi:IclR family transcriptional regulator, KDG regulon repressor
MAAPGPRKIKSAERTLALFELFSREQAPFTVGRISRSLDIPQPSVTMLLRNLQDLGYLEYDRASRTYTPSIRVALLGAWIDRRFGAAGAIGERLGALHRRVGETAFIGIQSGSAAQYVLAQTPVDPDRLEVWSGQHRSLTCSAMGRALLSLKPDAEVLAWARRCNAEASEDRFKVREKEFLALIWEVRNRGYAATAGDVTPGLGAFAVAFASPMGRMPLAVGVGGPLGRISHRRDEIVAALADFRAAFGEAREDAGSPSSSNGAATLGWARSLEVELLRQEAPAYWAGHALRGSAT